MIADITSFLRKQRCIKIKSTKTRPADTNAYTAGDVLGDNEWVFDSLGEADGIILNSIVFTPEAGGLPSGISSFKLHFYSEPTAVPLADNAANTFLSADSAKYLFTVDVNPLVDKGDFLNSYTNDINAVLPFINGKVYARLETDGSFTPAASVVINITLIGVGV